MRRAAVLLVSVITTALASVKVYDVAPCKCFNGFTAGGQASYVAQEFVACADTLLYAEFFAGQKPSTPGPQGYMVEVMDGSTALLRGYADDQREWAYVRADLSEVPGAPALVKGKTYLLKVSHTANPPQPVNYFYDPNESTYAYGNLIVDGTPQEDWDLALRIEGLMRPVGSSWFGNLVRAPDSGSRTATVVARAESAGVGADRIEVLWNDIQPTEAGGFHFGDMDDIVYFSKANLGIPVLGMLDYSAAWASSRTDHAVKCPPRNLFEWPDTAHDAPNYWSSYADTVVRHCSDSVDAWEVWNEPNVWREHFMIPDTYYTLLGSDTARAMCSLYVQLVKVAAQTIRSKDPTAKVIVGALSGVFDVGTESNPKFRGRKWLEDMYDLAGSVCWDGVSVHYYHRPFDPATFRKYADTLRAIMRENGDPGELWVTECGVSMKPSSTEEEQANHLCNTFVSPAASLASPAGGFDRMFWYSFLPRGEDTMWFGILDTSLEPRKAMYAAGQTAEHLTGKRFNRRVLTGDPGVDEATRIYEFEDPDSLKRTWVCWKNGGATGDSVVGVPVRSDDVRVDSLHYTGDEDPTNPTPGADGWLEQTLTTRPVFIRETGEVERPDLLADSVWSVPAKLQVSQQCSLYVRAVNHGSAETGGGSSNPPSPNTVARFYVDDGLIGYWEHTPSIGIGDTVKLAIAWTPNSAVVGLLRATVNDDQAYVEESMDDNAAYRSLAPSD